MYIQPFLFVPYLVASQGILFLPAPFSSPFATAYLPAFFFYLQFFLNEFGMLEILTEAEAEAIKALSASAINASPTSFAPAAVNASAASSADLEGELFAVGQNMWFLEKLLETGLKGVFQQRRAPWRSMWSESLPVSNVVEVFRVNVITAES